MFNILGNDCNDKVVLDICCGTASLGIEALSRGALRVVCVDTVIKTAITNIKKVKEKNPKYDISVIKSDCTAFLKRFKGQADIIFLDPPWKEELLYRNALKQIFDFEKLAPEGIIVCESSARASFIKSQELQDLEPQQYKYGDTLISIFKKQ